MSKSEPMRKVGDEGWVHIIITGEFLVTHGKIIYVDDTGYVVKTQSNIYDADFCGLVVNVYDTFDEALKAALEKVKCAK